MANKFQKSVLERLEQEAVRQKQKTKTNKKENREHPIENSAGEIEIIAKENPEHAVEVEAAPPPEGSRQISEPQQPVYELPALPDIGEYLRRYNLRLAKNKTFYLDMDVIEAVKSTAKAQSVTDSKLVNDILRRVLGLR